MKPMTDATRRFSLRDLFECVTLCALAAATAPILGNMAAGLLLSLVLALAARQGLLALLLLTAGMVAAGAFNDFSSADSWLRQFGAFAVASAIVAWYVGRRHLGNHQRHPCPADPSDCAAFYDVLDLSAIQQPLPAYYNFDLLKTSAGEWQSESW